MTTPLPPGVSLMSALKDLNDEIRANILDALDKQAVEDLAETAMWLSGQDAYTLHRPATRRFPRRKTIVQGPGVQLQADLMNVSSHAAQNDDTRFLLTTVDAFSRFARVVPLRDKGGKEVT